MNLNCCFKNIAMFGMCCLVVARVVAQAELNTSKIADGIYVITGSGGNVTLIVGDNRALLVDDQYAHSAAGILTEVAKVTDKPLDLVFNTHSHGDHSGGNQVMGEHGAVIIAHENVRKTLSQPGEVKLFNMQFEAYPEIARPQITFSDSMSFHLQGEDIKVSHFPQAHSTGDGVLYLPNANILITGDLYFNGFYPFIDGENGGKIMGVIAAAEGMLATIDDSTIIVPGHGPLARKADLAAFKSMLEASVAAILPLKDSGLSLDEIVAKKPTAAIDPQWGNGFLAPDVWVRVVYSAL